MTENKRSMKKSSLDFSGIDLPGCLSGLRILVVEDNPFNQLIAQEVLESTGALVVIAGNGNEAVECLHSGMLSFDAVLMDVQMPIMDGYEATRKIRSFSGSSSLPIIAMTASTSEGDLQRCLEAGMNGHLVKPIQREMLVETLNRYCKNIPSGTGHGAGYDNTGFSMDDEERAGLPGLDVADAIKKLNGNRLLYSQIARMVCKKYENFAKQVEYLIVSGDSETAGKLLHTFKGVALNLGAFKVGEFAGIFEEALTEGIAEDNRVWLLHRLEVLAAEAIDSLRIIADRYDPQKLL